MRKLSASVALGSPRGRDGHLTAAAVDRARHGRQDVEVRLGVGPVSGGGVPARVVGHAGCIQEALRSDVPSLAARPRRIFVFSSATKAGSTNIQQAVHALASLAGALRLAGVSVPIVLELADPHQEVPDLLNVVLPDSLIEWFERAARHSGSEADPRRYALEHAGPSMFGDLSDEAAPPLRITLGAMPEARFWAARWRVRASALDHDFAVAPAAALIFKSLRVPWYCRLVAEPLVDDLVSDPSAAVRALSAAADPSLGGNAGIGREARVTRRLIADAGPQALAAHLPRAGQVQRFLRRGDFEVGPRLASALKEIA